MKIETSFRVNVAGLQHALSDPNGPVAKDLARRAQRVRDQAVVNATGRPGPNVDTGRLRSSIGWRLVPSGRTWYAEVFCTVRYAGFVEFGTGPFVIVPRGRARGGKQALYWEGAAHPVARVNRRGNRAYPFLRPALIAGQT